ncbi:glycosyltransferase family 4 protein [Patescibacteria group bacterium]|nr:glycosyltransferase family 4 protein [Patescibacteria group bacterium]
MKIGIYDPYLDTLGGGERYMLTIASCLSKNNDVSILWNSSDVLEKAISRFNLDLKNVRLSENIFSSKISLPQRLLKSREYDLIIFLSDGSIPIVLSSLIIHFQFPAEWIKLNVLTKFKLLRVGKIICNSKFTKSYIDKKLRVDSRVLYPPIGEIETSLVKKENLILTVGRLGLLETGATFKKQELLIEAFKKMCDLGLKDTRFVVAVSYKEKDQKALEKIKNLTEDYPIEIVENISFAAIKGLYEKAKIYWHAAGFGEDLNTSPERAEHFGISTVEAMLAGAVPIVFGGGGQLEIVQSGQNGFIWHNQEDLIAQTNKMLLEQEEWEKISKEAKERSKDFTGDRFCKEINEIIKK